MKKGFVFIAIVGGLVVLLGLETPPAASIGVGRAIAYFKKESREFAESATRMEKGISVISKDDTLTILRARTALADCRLHYKRIEFFLEYFFRSASTVYNLPPKAEVEEPHMEYQEPTGLQVIESLLFEKNAFAQKEALLQQASLISGASLDLGSLLYDFKANDRQVLESIRFELIRVMTLGIAGFDAPSLKTGITESGEALRSMQEILLPYIEKCGEGSGCDSREADSVRRYLGLAIRLLEKSSANARLMTEDFDAFDRMTFLTDAALPLQEHLGRWVHEMGLELNTDPVLNPLAKNLFDPAIFNLGSFPKPDEADTVAANRLLYGSASYAPDSRVDVDHSPDTLGRAPDTRTSPPASPYSPAYASSLVELGRRLFFEKALSGNYTRNCASCHEPAHYFTDKRPKSLAYDGHSTVKRNAPTLLYAAFQYNQFLDGRVRSLEEQVLDVLHNPIEMNANYDTLCRRLSGRPEYVKLFAKAFGKDRLGVEDKPAGTGPTVREVAAAIAAFVRTLGPRNADFDRYMTGDRKALTPAQIRGFNLFMGKAQCGTCHFAPLFNGLTPPLYERSEFEVLNVPATDDLLHVKADSDSGRYSVFPISFYLGAFRIPGLRNIAVTGPYMHQGSFQSLDKVLDFYNKGGGVGLGMDIPLQTLSSTPLGLTEAEKKEIIDFLQSLTDRLPAKF